MRLLTEFLRTRRRGLELVSRVVDTVRVLAPYPADETGGGESERAVNMWNPV